MSVEDDVWRLEQRVRALEAWPGDDFLLSQVAQVNTG